MLPEPRNLRARQEWLQAVLMNPHGWQDSVESSVNEVIRESIHQTSSQRLEVYSHAYFARLLEVMREEYPTLTQFLGEDTFNGIALEYLSCYPSRSYTLGQLGRDFPRFLRESQQRLASEGLCDHGEAVDDHSVSKLTTKDVATDAEELMPGWCQFLVDVATVERLYSEVFDGPGVEGEKLLDPDMLRAIPTDQVEHVVFNLVPCLKLVELQFPVHEFITASRREPSPPLPAPQATWLAITRRQFVVRRIVLSHTQFRLLNLLGLQYPLGEALAEVARLDCPGAAQTENPEWEQHLASWFQDWAATGFFWSLRVS